MLYVAGRAGNDERVLKVWREMTDAKLTPSRASLPTITKSLKVAEEKEGLKFLDQLYTKPV